MKRIITLALLATLANLASAFSFDDITYWAGSGSSRSALVVDWNDNGEPKALAWGYRWDGSATGEDMFKAIVSSDPHLFSKVKSFGFGLGILGIGYDIDGDGLPLSDGTAWPSDGLLFTEPSDGAAALDSGDRYAEGWNTGFYSYWLSSGSSLGAWTEAQTGVSGRFLENDSWDGLSFAPGFIGSEPDEPVAAPEPCSLLAVLGLAAVLRRRKANV